MDKKKLMKILKKMGKNTKYLIIPVIAIVFVGILAWVIFTPRGGTSFSAETSLKEVFEISDLATAEYTYNSIVELKNDKETMCHIAYKGVVKVGINFENIQITETDEKISVVIPEIEVQSVDVETMLDYIFLKDKYNSETIYPTAYKACIDDLTTKASENQTLFDTARESAIDMVVALLRPFESQLAEGQTFEVVFASEVQEDVQ